MSHAKRMLGAYSGEHGVYGVVLVTALIAVGWDDDTDLEVLIFVIGTVFVFWLAHIYAAVVASRAAATPPSLRTALALGIRHTYGMLVAMLIPAFLLWLAVIDVVEEYTAYYLALGSGVVTLAVIGYANAARNRSPWYWRVAGVLATTALGLLVIVLSIIVH
jgi:positive regulator of sigma E activity